LLSHERRMHRKWRPYQCSFGEKMFKTNSELQTHKHRVHSKWKLHQSRYCTKMFKANDKLKCRVKSTAV